MEFAIVMIVLVVAAVVWLLLATRANGLAAKRARSGRRAEAGWVGPGAYTTGTFGGPIDSGGSAGCDSGGGA